MDIQRIKEAIASLEIIMAECDDQELMTEEEVFCSNTDNARPIVKIQKALWLLEEVETDFER